MIDCLRGALRWVRWVGFKRSYRPVFSIIILGRESRKTFRAAGNSGDWGQMAEVAVAGVAALSQETRRCYGP